MTASGASESVASKSNLAEPTISRASCESFPIVLDTNAVLDWLLFRDKGLVRIAAAIESGEVNAIASEATLEELRRVLRYPEFKLDEARQTELLRCYREQVCVVSVDAESTPAVVFAIPDALLHEAAVPRCKDPDDQKFLELAAQEGAVLVTKDKLLLKLARRVAKAGGFAILRPDLLVERYLS